MYQSINQNYDEFEIYHNTHSNKKQMVYRFYCFVSVLMIIFFGIATYDIVYWKKECNLKNFNYHNKTEINEESHKLHCYIFLYGVTFYFYLLVLVLFALYSWFYFYSNYDYDINMNWFKKSLYYLTTKTKELILYLFVLLFFAVVIGRIILYVMLINEYSRCKSLCNSANVFITIVPFSAEFLLNVVFFAISLYTVYFCLS
jgi:hypothetical protein